MKNKLGVLVVCLFCQIVLGQNGFRKPLHGQVINDFLAIEKECKDKRTGKSYMLFVISYSGTFLLELIPLNSWQRLNNISMRDIEVS